MRNMDGERGAVLTAYLPVNGVSLLAPSVNVGPWWQYVWPEMGFLEIEKQNKKNNKKTHFISHLKFYPHGAI